MVATDQVITEPREVYEGKVAVSVFEEGPVRIRWVDINREIQESEYIFEKVEEGSNPLLPDIVYFLRREDENTIWVRPIDVKFRSDPSYVDFGNRHSWRSPQVCAKGEDYADPEFQSRDELLRRYGK